MVRTPDKMRYLTNGMRLIGFANGLEDSPKNVTLRALLLDAGRLMLEDWNAWALQYEHQQFNEDGTVKESDDGGDA